MSLARLARERRQGGGAAASSPTIPPSLTRIRSEVEAAKQRESAVAISSADPYHVEVTIRPQRGTWAGGCFNFLLRFSPEFPVEGPKIRYMGPNRVFHPNIEGDADQKDWGVCLGLQTEWKPLYSISDLVVGLEQLFEYPTYDDPLPGVAREAAQLLKDNPDAFATKARRWMSGTYV